MLPTYYITLGVLTLVMVANLVPIGILFCSKTLRKDVFYRGLICLCVNAVVTAPLTYLLIFHSSDVSHNMCIFLMSVTDVLVLQAYLHHLLISTERFCACRLTRYSAYFTSWHQVIYIFLTYVIAVGTVLVVQWSCKTDRPINSLLIYYPIPEVQIVYSSYANLLILGVVLLTGLSLYYLFSQFRKLKKVCCSEKNTGDGNTEKLKTFCMTISTQKIPRYGPPNIPFRVPTQSADQSEISNIRISKTCTVEPSSSVCSDNVFQSSHYKSREGRRRRGGVSAKTLLIVVVTLVLCNVPYHVVQTVAFFTGDIADDVICVTYYLSKCQYILNPVIYMWRIGPIRNFIRCKK